MKSLIQDGLLSCEAPTNSVSFTDVGANRSHYCLRLWVNGDGRSASLQETLLSFTIDLISFFLMIFAGLKTWKPLMTVGVREVAAKIKSFARLFGRPRVKLISLYCYCAVVFLVSYSFKLYPNIVTNLWYYSLSYQNVFFYCRLSYLIGLHLVFLRLLTSQTNKCNLWALTSLI